MLVSSEVLVNTIFFYFFFLTNFVKFVFQQLQRGQVLLNPQSANPFMQTTHKEVTACLRLDQLSDAKVL